MLDDTGFDARRRIDSTPAIAVVVEAGQLDLLPERLSARFPDAVDRCVHVVLIAQRPLPVFGCGFDTTALVDDAAWWVEYCSYIEAEQLAVLDRALASLRQADWRATGEVASLPLPSVVDSVLARWPAVELAAALKGWLPRRIRRLDVARV